MREAAWPLIRRDLGLSYVQVGLILSVPLIAANIVEPVLGILGDTFRRRAIVLAGGVTYAGALVAIAVSPVFLILLAGMIPLYPASGAFVSLSQATLMDRAPERRERAMARWNVAGSVGVLVGPLFVSGFVLLNLGWRPLFGVLAAITACAVLLTAHQGNGYVNEQVDEGGLRAGIASALRAMRRPEVVRWLLLLEAADLLLDVLLGYLALYFVDVVGSFPAEAALAVTVWSGAWLLGGAAMIPLLARISGLRYLRVSAAAELVLFPLFLLVPGFGPKIVLAGLLALLNAGWYPTLKGRLYGAMPSRSGAVMAVGSIAGLGSALIPLALGAAAESLGLGTALWLLVLAPVALICGVPREE